MAPPTVGSVGGSADKHFDILVIGGGISGINASHRISTLLPHASFTVLESRHEIGGTWSQFKYPGVRSDSDLHTFGFPFNPWKSSNTIASGESIMEYMNETVQKFDLAKYMRFGQRVKSADWITEEQRWRVQVDVTGGGGEGLTKVVYWAKWIITGTGYYNYEQPAKANVAGLETFRGHVVRPQFWPTDLELKDKRIVVVGSGATTITLLPALVKEGAKSVTQLQRSPSYVLNVPQEKPGEETWVQRMMPAWLFARWTRFVHILMPIVFYYFCIYFPIRAHNLLRSEAKRQLPADFPIDPHLKPGYNPWSQRLCYCPDGDYFRCFESGRASIVTDTIKNVTPKGIDLQSGEKLEADIIVLATGLQMQIFGGMELTVNGEKVSVPEQYLWRTCMLTTVPNFLNIMGYWNHSWTLGSDISTKLFVRIYKRMVEKGFTSVTPTISQEDLKSGEARTSPLSSTYVKAGLSVLPKSANRGPWRPRPNWFVDTWRSERADLSDGLVFGRRST